MAFAYKFVLYYLLYIVIWAGIWQIGFGNWYIASGYQGEINLEQFEPSLSTNYRSFVASSYFSESQLKNLDAGTKILAHVSMFTGSPNQMWLIYGFTNETWFECFQYWIYEAGLTPQAESHICWSDITYVYSDSPLTEYNITANTTNAQTLTATVSLTPTSLWTQITLFFGLVSGVGSFFTNIWWLGFINFAFFMTFLYCLAGEILIPFGIKIPFV